MSALACLKRRKAEFVALLSIVVAGLAPDLLALAVWLEIDNEAYGKVAGVAFVWSFLSLVILGLTLAVGAPRSLARLLYFAAVGATVVAALILTWLIATAGGGSDVSDGTDFYFVPFASVGNDELLRVLGAVLVLLAALWFAALAASRLERPGREITR